MSTEGSGRGGTPVGYVTDLDPVEAASVMYLRMWCDGPEAQAGSGTILPVNWDINGAARF